MSLYFKCPVCGKKLKAADEFCGRVVACTACRTRIVVPAFGTAAQTASAEGDEETSQESGPALILPPSKLAGYEDLIDMTAMVDIVFFILIFFLVTSMQEIMASMEVQPPDSQQVAAQGRKTAAEVDADAASVRIDADDTIWLDGGKIASEQDLRSRLRAARKDGVTKLAVTGHGDSHHKTLVMVLDAGNDAGLTDMKFVVSDEEP
jgi:biopolymer transport protein ExbD/DNA-directed RNA polymerase subunit RPC12/RpoP